MARTRTAKGSRTAGPPSKKVIAAIASAAHADKFTLLATALDRANFWQWLQDRRRIAKVPRAKFEILIKPDLEVFDEKSPTGTDPELVEHLIDLLHVRGFRRVAVCGAKDSSDLWLENRDVMVLAELAGYRYTTPGGHDYEVIDLGQELMESAFPEESALRGEKISRRWMEADFRISFAKNKTDDEYGFALGAQNLLGVLPRRDKTFHYHRRLKAPDVCLALLRRAPANFSIIDAFVSNHGSLGAGVPRPIETRTIIASTDMLLADLAASLKMRLDPFVSPINGKALREVSLPKGHEIVGDLAPYEGWINVPPVLMDSVRKRNESAAISRLVAPWLRSVNRELFPFKDAANERINAFAQKFFGDIDGNAAAFSGMLATNYLASFARDSVEAFHILYEKSALKQYEAPLDFDLGQFTPADYRAVVDYMEPLECIIRATPPEPNGLRWRYIDGSVLFEFSQLIDAPFAKFVARVDISKAVQSMNDYIGGACVPVAHDRAGRVTHQAERNIYLPQPNWMVLFGGKVIDVGKLEFIHYDRDRYRIFWRSIKSSNGSAEFDDGIVTFAREKKQTRVTIVARQKFALPLFWQIVNIDLAPRIKNPLVVQAYTNYFTGTIANFVAQYRGREFRAGHPWDLLESDDEASGLHGILRAFGLGDGALERSLAGLAQFTRPTGEAPRQIDTPSITDENGFRHFPGRDTNGGGGPRLSLATALGEARGFFADLATAMKKDLDVVE